MAVASQDIWDPLSEYLPPLPIAPGSDSEYDSPETVIFAPCRSCEGQRPLPVLGPASAQSDKQARAKSRSLPARRARGYGKHRVVVRRYATRGWAFMPAGGPLEQRLMRLLSAGASERVASELRQTLDLRNSVHRMQSFVRGIGPYLLEPPVLTPPPLLTLRTLSQDLNEDSDAEKRWENATSTAKLQKISAQHQQIGDALEFDDDDVLEDLPPLLSQASDGLDILWRVASQGEGCSQGDAPFSSLRNEQNLSLECMSTDSTRLSNCALVQ